MNYVDFAILGIFALCILIGYNRGFLKAAFNFANFFISLWIAFANHDKLAASINNDGKLVPTLIQFSEASDMLGDVENVRLSIYDISIEKLDSIMSTINLPHPLKNLLLTNIENQAFSTQGITTLGDYLGTTIAHMTVNILCFVAIFAISYVLICVVIDLCDHVIRFPMLHYLDRVAGGILGFLQGMLLLFVVFLLVPLVLAYLPFNELVELIDSSSFAAFYYRSNFIIDMIKGVI